MDRVMRRVWAAALALGISLAADAQHVLPGGPAPRLQTPIATAPIPQCGTAGTPAVAPPQVGLNVVAVYAILTLPPNPNASQYTISRLMTSVPNQPAYVVSGLGFKGNEFWDAFPDVRYQYAYTVTMLAVQRCYVSTTVTVSPPYKLTNPAEAYGAVRYSETPATLSWYEALGAIAYRVDGPGLPNTGMIVPGETYIPGQHPNPVGTPVAGLANPAWRIAVNVPDPGVAPNAAQFWVTAIYAGNNADYTNRSLATFGRVRPTITSIPASLLDVETLVIKGNYLYDPSDSGAPVVAFGVPKTGWDQQHTGVIKGTVTLKSPTEVDVALAPGTPSGYVSLLTYDVFVPGSTGNVSAVAVSATTLTVVPHQVPPPPPPPQVRVPSVFEETYTHASSDLVAAGFSARSANGVAGVVLKQSPEAGAMANKGSAITLTMTTGAGSGVSKIIINNGTNDGHSLYIWLYDGSTQVWSLDSSNPLASGATTTLTLQSGHVYTVEGMDSAMCGNTDHDTVSCQRDYVSGIIGDTNGSPAGVTF